MRAPRVSPALEAGIGVAVLKAGDTLDTLLARADADLYAQKTARSAPPR